MKPTIFKSKAILFMVMISVSAIGLIAQSQTETKKQTVMDQWYSLYEKDSDQRIGAKHLTVEKINNQLIVKERVSLQDQNSTLSYDTEVRYDTQPNLRAAWAQATTYIDGRPYMSGMIEVNPENLEMSSALIEQGKITEPVVTDIYQLKTPTTIVFYQGLEYIGQKLLQNKDSVDDITFVVFPAELDTIAELENQCRIVSEKKGQQKEVQVHSKQQSKPLCQWTLGQSDQIKSGTFSQARMVAASKEKALQPLTQEGTSKQKNTETSGKKK